MAKLQEKKPTFFLHWVENGKLSTTKRYDWRCWPWSPVSPPDIFDAVQTVFPDFDHNKHIIKFPDAGHLIDISRTDEIIFQFNENYFQVSFYIFSSVEDAANFTSSRSLAFLTQKFSEFSLESIRMEGAGPSVESSNALVSDPRELIKTAYRLATEDVNKKFDCDVCGRFLLFSNRYECLECKSFKMCEKCEFNGVHPVHLVARISMAFMLKHEFNVQDALKKIFMKAVNLESDAARSSTS